MTRYTHIIIYISAGLLISCASTDEKRPTVVIMHDTEYLLGPISKSFPGGIQNAQIPIQSWDNDHILKIRETLRKSDSHYAGRLQEIQERQLQRDRAVVKLQEMLGRHGNFRPHSASLARIDVLATLEAMPSRSPENDAYMDVALVVLDKELVEAERRVNRPDLWMPTSAQGIEQGGDH